MSQAHPLQTAGTYIKRTPTQPNNTHLGGNVPKQPPSTLHLYLHLQWVFSNP